MKNSVHAIESEELKAHLKTTDILFKGVKSEISKITDKVEGIKDYVDTSIGIMITKTQDATIINNQKELQKSQQLIQEQMQAMDAKFDLLLSSLLNADAKKGEKALVTKSGPELKSNPDDREGGGAGKNKESAGSENYNCSARKLSSWVFKWGMWIFFRTRPKTTTSPDGLYTNVRSRNNFQKIHLGN